MGSSASKEPIKYELVDILETVTGKEEETIIVMNEKTGVSSRWHRKMWGYLFTEQKIFIFIILSIVGSLSACTAFLIDFTISELYNVVESNLISYGPYVTRYTFYILYSVLFCFLSAVTAILVSPYSTGSGIPEMKSILSGVHIPYYLSPATMIAKVLGLICAFAGGLSIGKEGPYVHISSIIAEWVMNIPIWNKLARNNSLRFQIISAACAVGVSTSFGSPIGGVLFSIEVTSTYYMVENLWKAFWCSMFGALIIRLLAEFGFQVGLISLFRLNGDSFATVDLYDWRELIIYIFVGLSGGLLGAFFVRTTRWLILYSDQIKCLDQINGTIVRAVSVGFIVAFLSFPFPLIRSDQAGIDYLFDAEKKDSNEIFFLFGMVIIKFLVTSISQLAGLACGVYTPLFILGAAYGRFIGEVIAYFIPTGISPLSYAVVGAAAVCGSATHTISTAVIVVELTGQYHLLLPILIAVLVADGIAKLVSDSIYDELLNEKGLPFMPTFVVGASTKNLTAQDIMVPADDVYYLTLNSTYEEAAICLQQGKYAFPLINNEDNKMLLGIVKRNELVDLLKAARRKEKIIRSYSSLIEENPLPLHSPHVEEERKLEEEEEDEDEEFELPEHFQVRELLRNEDPMDYITESADLLAAEEEGKPPVVVLSSPSRREFEDIDTTIPFEKRTIPFVFTNSSCPAEFSDMVVVDPTTFCVSEEVPLSKIHFIFTMLGIREVCVTHRGLFVGVITKNALLAHLRSA